MRAVNSQRGAAPVGYIAELDPIGTGAVLYLRLWSDGSNSRLAVRNDFMTALGSERGARALKSIEALCDLCVRYGHRPLTLHGVACACLGADESWFANFIGCASEGAREDAFLMATNIVRPDMAGILAGFAEDFGLALRRIAIGFGRRPDNPSTLH